MKTLKFRRSLSRLILQGKKDSTWRLFDDKGLSAGDVVSFLVWETKEEFAKAVLTAVKETSLGELTEEDWEGHEKFDTEEDMYEEFSKYYSKKVDKGTRVKIIRFKLRA